MTDHGHFGVLFIRGLDNCQKDCGWWVVRAASHLPIWVVFNRDQLPREQNMRNVDDIVYPLDALLWRVLRPLPPKAVVKIHAMNSPKSIALHRARVIFLVRHALGHITFVIKSHVLRAWEYAMVHWRKEGTLDKACEHVFVILAGAWTMWHRGG